MVEVGSVSVCRCGARFPSDGQLDSHVHQAFGPWQEVPAGVEPPAPETFEEDVDPRFSLALADSSPQKVPA